MLINRRERGATAIFVAFALLLLIGVAAVAIDLAQGWNERRQDQTSVDIAAVAGALSFGSGTDAIADEVMDAARTNLDTTYSDSEWNDLWTDCDGSTRPPGFGAAPSSIGTIDCIGLNPSFIWAKLPDQLVDTSFGRVLGVDTLTARAEVIVTLIGEGGSGALPFAVKANVPPGEICLETGPGGHAEEPCEGPESGSFGNIAPQMFGNEALGTSQWCRNNPGTPSFDNIAQAIAMGIDHALFKYPEPFDAGTWASSSEAHRDQCTTTSGFVAEPADGVPINTIYIDTGNYVKGEVTEGLITGGTYPDGAGPRLTRTGANTREVLGVQVDNNPLWKYLQSTSTHGVVECDGPTIQVLPTIEEKNDAMQACLSAYVPSDGQIFSDAILESPRLGVAPRLWHDTLPEGFSEPRPIHDFEVVYVHGIWLKKGGSPIPFFPDDDGSDLSSGSTPIQQVTAYLLSNSMVSDNVHEALGGLTDDTWQPEIYE
jgi:hypothetical protein